MLITKDILKEFNKYCYKIQIEYNRLEYTDTVSNAWPVERMNRYRFGIVCGLMQENDSKIIEILKYQYDKEMLYSLVKTSVNRQEHKAKRLFEKYDKLELYKPSNFTLTLDDNIYEWVKKYCYLYFEPVKERVISEQLVFLLLQLSYDEYYNNKIHQVEIEQPNLDNIFNKNNYCLIDINENAIQVPGIYNRIYIKNINKTVFCSIDNRLAKIIYDLRERGCIKKLALRGKNDYVFDGMVKTAPLCEEIERGMLFTWDIKKLHNITKLYDGEYYLNNMWIFVSNGNMIFEEMQSNEFEQDDSLVTSVIHLEYYLEDNNYYISHIDHEYIFYSIDEYEKRKVSPDQKGHKRVKTFKIDESSILMNHHCKLYDNNNNYVVVPFIYYVLNLYFNNKKLVEEYFSMVE